MNGKLTKKAKAVSRDAMRPEYQRDALGKGVRGKYFSRHNQGSNLVLLQPEVAKVFPTPAAVNEALRGLMQIAQRAAHT